MPSTEIQKSDVTDKVTVISSLVDGVNVKFLGLGQFDAAVSVMVVANVLCEKNVCF